MLRLYACSCVIFFTNHFLVDARRVTFTGQNLEALATVGNSSQEEYAGPAPPMDLSLQRAIELQIMSDSSFLDCLVLRESGPAMQSRVVEFVKEMWVLDFYLNFLTEKERQELNGLQTWLVNKLQSKPWIVNKLESKGIQLKDFGWTDRLRELEGKRDVLDRMKSFADGGFPGLIKPPEEWEATPSKPEDFNGSDEEWVQEWVRRMFTDDTFDYEARFSACQEKQGTKFENELTKMQLELTTPCEGEARMVESLSSCKARSNHTCPEGSSCGVVWQKDPRKFLYVAPVMIALTHAITFGICLMLGAPGAVLVIPGQAEVGLLAATFLARSGHNCACKPQSCKYSDNQEQCVLEGASPTYASLPLAGFKCSLEEGEKKSTCKLAACDAEDYQAPLTGSYHNRTVEGRLGKVGRELFNCWRVQDAEGWLPATANFQISSSLRREFYEGRSL
mmetsp:Transcript_126342/g.223777  ORF Transcript_126342/g.223777 Transcript_126342/m.223777 type:complete len:449 (+) Transcript_126342:148-1494(+)